MIMGTVLPGSEEEVPRRSAISAGGHRAMGQCVGVSLRLAGTCGVCAALNGDVVTGVVCGMQWC